MSRKSFIHNNPWLQLRQLTPARIALGRAGTSLPTAPLLDFQFAHAQARDAVHMPLDFEQLVNSLSSINLECIRLESAAKDRGIFLQRPDLGRRLSADSAERLQRYHAEQSTTPDLAIVIADGLSALAIERHATPFLKRLLESLHAERWSLAPLCLVKQGRVAVADEIGELLAARMTLILIGERPGLSSPDSMGLYFTFAPRVGLTDASRNCISNVRLEGLSYTTAVFRLMCLMREAWRRQLSGVNLKDEAEMLSIECNDNRNFLLD